MILTDTPVRNEIAEKAATRTKRPESKLKTQKSSKPSRQLFTEAKKTSQRQPKSNPPKKKPKITESSSDEDSIPLKELVDDQSDSDDQDDE